MVFKEEKLMRLQRPIATSQEHPTQPAHPAPVSHVYPIRILSGRQTASLEYS